MFFYNRANESECLHFANLWLNNIEKISNTKHHDYFQKFMWNLSPAFLGREDHKERMEALLAKHANNTDKSYLCRLLKEEIHEIEQVIALRNNLWPTLNVSKTRKWLFNFQMNINYLNMAIPKRFIQFLKQNKKFSRLIFLLFAVHGALSLLKISSYTLLYKIIRPFISKLAEIFLRKRNIFT